MLRCSKHASQTPHHRNDCELRTLDDGATMPSLADQIASLGRVVLARVARVSVEGFDPVWRPPGCTIIASWSQRTSFAWPRWQAQPELTAAHCHVRFPKLRRSVALSAALGTVATTRTALWVHPRVLLPNASFQTTKLGHAPSAVACDLCGDGCVRDLAEIQRVCAARLRRAAQIEMLRNAHDARWHGARAHQRRPSREYRRVLGISSAQRRAQRSRRDPIYG